jgi:hypothetical protein
LVVRLGEGTPSPDTDERKALQESLESASSPKMVWRSSNPPSINGPPGCFEDEEPAQKSDMESLIGVVATLRNNNRVLQERVAELKWPI